MRITEFLQEGGNKQLSSARLGFLVWTLGLFGLYAYGVIVGRAEPLPQSLDVIGITLILGGLKGFQKGKENGNGKPADPPVQ